MANAESINIYLCDDSDAIEVGALASVLRRNGLRVRKLGRVRSNRWTSVDGPSIIVATLDRLPEVAEIASAENRRNRLKSFLIRSDSACTTNDVLHSMSEASIRILRNVLVYRGTDVPRRVIAAWADGVPDQMIAEASVAADTLAVYDCAMKRHEVRFEDIAALRSIPVAERSSYEIDEDGSFILWPSVDVHVNLEMLRESIDPEYRAESSREARDRNARYGRAISRIRKRAGLAQSDFEGISERQLRRIENGATATENALRALAAGHGMSLKRYLNTIAEEIVQ